MTRTLYIEAEQFHGNTISGWNELITGYGLEHVYDVNTEKSYTLIFKGDKVYSYEEKENN